MTMTDTPIETPKKKKPRKARKTPRRASFQKPPEKMVPDEFTGLTPTECCNACNKDHCVISGINVCSHPFKCGLQSTQLNQPETVKRFNRAKAVLKDQMIDLRLR